jgi:hypothetical protein
MYSSLIMAFNFSLAEAIMLLSGFLSFLALRSYFPTTRFFASLNYELRLCTLFNSNLGFMKCQNKEWRWRKSPVEVQASQQYRTM